MADMTDVTKRFSTMYWSLRHHIPETGTAPLEQRWIIKELAWAAHPDEGFMVTHDRDEDHGGVETVTISRATVESGDATWRTHRDTTVVERLVVEDLASESFRPEDCHYAPRTEQAIAARLFAEVAVPRLGAMGTWKRADAVQPGEVVVATWERQFSPPRTVLDTGTDYANAYWGPRVKLTCADDQSREIDSYLDEHAWVCVAPTGQ